MVSVFLKLFLWLEHGFQCVNCYSSMSNETNLVGHYHFNKNEIENRKYECSFCSKGKYCLMKLSCVYITLLLGWCKCNCGFCIVEICCLILKYILNKCGYGYISFFFNFFIFKLYNIVLVLPNIEMNPPQVYMCSPSWTLLPHPSQYHPSGSPQCTSPKHPVSCIEPGLATRFIYDITRISVPFSQIIPPCPSPTESKRLFYTSF